MYYSDHTVEICKMGNNKNIVKRRKMDENRVAKLTYPVVKPSTVSATKLQFMLQSHFRVSLLRFIGTSKNINYFNSQPNAELFQIFKYFVGIARVDSVLTMT